MNIKVNNPEFLLATLNNEVVNRTRYLVSQGIAYDSDWREGFVELFQVIEQLEIPIGDKLEEYMNDENSAQILVPDSYYTMPDGTQVRQKTPSEHLEEREVTLKEHEAKLALKYPLGLPVTLGKGKTVWSVDGYHGQMVHVSREGAGKNSIYVTPDKIKFVQNPFQQNDEEV